MLLSCILGNAGSCVSGAQPVLGTKSQGILVSASSLLSVPQLYGSVILYLTKFCQWSLHNQQYNGWWEGWCQYWNDLNGIMAVICYILLFTYSQIPNLKKYLFIHGSWGHKLRETRRTRQTNHQTADNRQSPEKRSWVTAGSRDRSPLPDRRTALSVSSFTAINNLLPFIPHLSVLPVNPWPLTHDLLHLTFHLWKSWSVSCCLSPGIFALFL